MSAQTAQTLPQLPGLRALDRQFAALMQRLAQQPDPALALGAALLSRESGAGHVCVPLARWAGRVLDGEAPAGMLQAGSRAPEIEAWTRALRASGVVDAGAGTAPLVLDPDGRLYLRRLWQAEQQLARQLRRRAAPVAIDQAALDRVLAQLFPGDAAQPDDQRRAVEIAATHGLAVISGGPGTGKTTTVTRLIAALTALHAQAPPRVALAAPTGKAAARLAQSLQRERAALPAALAAAVPQQVRTLHRLLGWRGDGFRHDARRLLACDLLVIDEASMVDLPLMAAALEALPPAARLVLVGDRDQLASVEAGSVLADICLGAAAGGPLARVLAELRRSYRYRGDSAIGQLAQAVNSGDGAGVLDVLDGPAPAVERRVLNAREDLAVIADEAAQAWRPVFSATTPQAALDALDRFRVLCALRRGPFGVEGLNDAIERALRRSGLLPASARGSHCHGRPILIQRNDPASGLYNGDTGIILADADGHLQAWFRQPDGTPVGFTPSRLPVHETAYAMTVHKSQGSEFGAVTLVLPPDAGPLITRELLYTAVTRARESVCVVGGEAVLRAALAQRTERASGLVELLSAEANAALDADGA